MSEEQLCPNCKQAIEDGATFCGNCGFKLVVNSPVSQVYAAGAATPEKAVAAQPAPAAGVPAYAVVHSHHKQHWSAMALAFGILGIGGGILVPLIGLAFGITGIVLTTSSWHISIKWVKIASLIVSIIAVLVGLGFWVNAILHDPKLNSQLSSSSSATDNVTTPCYSFTFSSAINVSNSSGSCSMTAYNGTNFNDSTNVYKVIASSETSLTTADFAAEAKQAIEQDISKNLPAFSVTNQASTSFSGSPAYYIQAIDKSAGVAVIEEAIYHSNTSSTTSDNFFDILHAVNGQSANLSEVQSGWQWND